MFNCYTHITLHVTQVFANCTHYTSYSLLNIVHVIVCFLVWPTKFAITLSFFVQNIFCVWELKGRLFENLNFGKTGFKTCVLEKHFISYSCILFIIFNALRSFFKNQVIFSKMLFFQNFNWFNLFFDQLKLHLKFFVSLCLFRSIETDFWSIKTRELGFKKKKSDLTRSNHFFKKFSNLFLSLRLGKSPQRIFCHFSPNFLQGFSLPKPVCLYYPSFCIV